MKLSISNIAWSAEKDEQVYRLLRKYGYTGLEIAPTRIFPESPYEHLKEAESWARSIYEKYGLSISSIQSIWYGKTENIFGTQKERTNLIEYTRKAIDFAEALRCGHLVFGCPKNRNHPEEISSDEAIPFFRSISEYAAERSVFIGLEANPVIYNTNFINTTVQALDFIEKVGSNGLKINLDVGTMVYNGESADILYDKVNQISHVHISEPGLNLIKPRKIHQDIAKILLDGRYDGFISIEMGTQNEIDEIEKTIKYVAKVFGQIG